jgi:hypothetical protein
MLLIFGYIAMKFSTDELQSYQTVEGLLEIDLAECISTLIVIHPESGKSMTFPEVNLKKSLTIAMCDRAGNYIECKAKIVKSDDNSLSLNIYVTSIICVMNLNESIRDINLAVKPQRQLSTSIRKTFDY